MEKTSSLLIVLVQLANLLLATGLCFLADKSVARMLNGLADRLRGAEGTKEDARASVSSRFYFFLFPAPLLLPSR